VIIDAGPFIVDGETLNSRLWALIRRASERGDDLHTTHPVLAQVWREPARQANLARVLRHFDIHPLDESVTIGRRLAATGTSDVVDAHLAVVAESLGTFILTADHDDMSRLNARFEVY
jgi:predicted nucleic acid-binding protein